MMITKPIPEHTEAISKICSDGWRQTVQGIYDEEYQAKNVDCLLYTSPSPRD